MHKFNLRTHFEATPTRSFSCCRSPLPSSLYLLPFFFSYSFPSPSRSLVQVIVAIQLENFSLTNWTFYGSAQVAQQFSLDSDSAAHGSWSTMAPILMANIDGAATLPGTSFPMCCLICGRPTKRSRARTRRDVGPNEQTHTVDVPVPVCVPVCVRVCADNLRGHASLELPSQCGQWTADGGFPEYTSWKFA